MGKSPEQKAKRKKPEIFRARATASSWFSKYIRLRDCITVTGCADDGYCCTCESEKLLPISKLQCGHFLPGRRDSILFDEQNAGAQCYQCNVRNQGRWPEFERVTAERWGQSNVDRLKQAYFDDAVKFSVEDYRKISDVFRKKYKELKDGKAI